MRSTTQTRSKNRDPATNEKICTATKLPKLSDRGRTSTARTAVRKKVVSFDNLTLSRKEGFQTMAEGPRREKPDELTATQLRNLGSSARYEYDEQRVYPSVGIIAYIGFRAAALRVSAPAADT
jgi:hypothetical protein